MERMIPSFLLQPVFISLIWGNRNSKISAPHQPHDINRAQRLFSFFQGHLGDVNSSEAPFLLYMLELASNSVIDSTTWRRCFCVVRLCFSFKHFLASDSPNVNHQIYPNLMSKSLAEKWIMTEDVWPISFRTEWGYCIAITIV